MNETKPETVSGIPGSTAGQSTKVPGSGETSVTDQFVERSVYESLEKKLGEQGRELGEARATLEDISPLMEALGDKPELIKAIVQGKITDELARGILEGKVTLEEAKIATEAHDEIMKTMEQQQNQAPAADLDKLVADKIQALIGDKLSKLDEIKEEVTDIKVSGQLQQEIDTFIAGTPDIGEYADDIEKYLDANPWVQNIEVAYHVVKGKAMAEKSEALAKEKQAEAEKNAALNVAGGSSNPGASLLGDEGLIPTSVNPNSWAG